MTPTEQNIVNNTVTVTISVSAAQRRYFEHYSLDELDECVLVIEDNAVTFDEDTLHGLRTMLWEMDDFTPTEFLYSMNSRTRQAISDKLAAAQKAFFTM